MFDTIRKLRHGRMKRLEPFWRTLGTGYRKVVRMSPVKPSIWQKIGHYGPFKMHANFAFSNFKAWGGHHNNCFAQCIEACRGKRCVVDVGAHIGLVAMPMSKVVAHEGCVIAFEPARFNRYYLRHHVRMNRIGNMVVSDQLLGNQVVNRQPFYEMRSDIGMNALIPKKNIGKYQVTYRRQTTLDSFCLRTGYQPQVIKIDVEGFEINVLRGASAILTRFRPIIFLSVHPKEIELMGQDVNDLKALLDELDYRILDAAGQAVQQFRLEEYVLTPKEGLIHA